jgi:hypothetical protein
VPSSLFPQRTIFVLCSMSCTYCDGLSGTHRWVHWADMVESVNKGCRGCAVITGAVQTYATSHGIGHPTSNVTFYVTNDGEPSFKISWKHFGEEFFIEIYTTEGRSPCLVLVCCTYQPVPGSKTSWPTLPIRRDVAAIASSDQCIKLARKWLYDCVENHSNCTPSQSTLPSRIIHVGDSDEDLHLYMPGKNEKTRYAILSHRWPDTPPLTTTLATLTERLRSISISALSKTFQDAVSITRSLGLEYVWIDSLCIIQDDSVDWAEQSSRMSDYYAGAFITVAADSAKDGASGCFNLRPEYALSQLLSLPGDSPADAIHVRRTADILDRRETLWHTFGSPNIHSTLDTRGWVLQERLLSTRTLHYGSSELSWECNVNTLCECQVKPHPRGPKDDINRNIRSRLRIARSPQATGRENLGSSTNDWMHMVEMYTARELSNKRDRLPAMAGLASAMGKANEYLCGLWNREGESDLLFFALLSWYLPHQENESPGDKSYHTSSRHGSYYAPSWSWASTTGPVKFHEHDEGRGSVSYQFSNTKASILFATCIPATVNPWGHVRGGYLILECGLSKVYQEGQVLYLEEEFWPWPSESGLSRQTGDVLEFYPDGPLGSAQPFPGPQTYLMNLIPWEAEAIVVRKITAHNFDEIGKWAQDIPPRCEPWMTIGVFERIGFVKKVFGALRAPHWNRRNIKFQKERIILI